MTARSTLDWNTALSRRALARGDTEITAILAGAPPGALSAAGGFPNPKTFPRETLDAIVAKLVRDEPGIALQYTPSEGLPSFREYLVDRTEQQQGRRPPYEGLFVTSGGMECLDLVSRSLLDPGDTVVVESPTYLGALMTFAGYEAQVVAIEMDEHGMRVEDLAERLADGLRPKFVYTIPEYQNPTGRTMPEDRRIALLETCARHGVLVLEDVAYRDISFDGANHPTLWSQAPELVVQAGTFSKSFSPGIRLGWAVGPLEVIGPMSGAKQNTDQCAGGLGQRMVEEYGRGGHFETNLPQSRALYAAHWAATARAFAQHLPDGCTWSVPTGGFFTWLTLPAHVDTLDLRVHAREAGITYVAGAPFYADGRRSHELRFAFSLLDEEQIDEAVGRLARAIRAAL